MITKEISASIARAYREIDAAESLIARARQFEELSDDNPRCVPVCGVATVGIIPHYSLSGVDLMDKFVFETALAVRITPAEIIALCEVRIAEHKKAISRLSFIGLAALEIARPYNRDGEAG